ncbi:MAG: von Willebrand factor type A domain-containing protein [Elusimicrobia bacterium]|nr:von Willebrand factor type A domain-containing protein [Elusimicrobiota bacterium]
MKYTDEEIKNKFSNVNFDKTGWKKQAVFNKIVAKQAGRSFNMRKRYLKLTAAASLVVLIAAVSAPFFINQIKNGNNAVYSDATENYTETENIAEDTISSAPQSAPAQVHYKARKTENQAPAGYARSSQIKAEAEVLQADFAPIKHEGALLGANVYSKRAVRMPSPTPITAPIRPAYPTQTSEQPLSKESKDYKENSFKKAALEPLSTFSADVDTASYSMLKEQINRGWDVQKESVRIEALINNFSYNYAEPKGAEPLGVDIEYSDAPWNKNNKLVKIGVKAKNLPKENRPQSNLVFLMDVSGSMQGSNRLPLAKKAIKMLLDQLDAEDLVSVVTYASGVDVKLDGVKAKNKKQIIQAIDSLRASGATYGEEGLKKAYETAKKNFLRKGNNRIIIASDGDFNVGNSSSKSIEDQVSEAKESGVFISALGFGMGNYRDALMETIADKGNGNYAYINDLKTAQKALVREFSGTMFTVAKDVKFQVEFNPAKVEDYRLIGYEKRALNNEDFNDDKKDAGEVGAGHTVTVLYEIRPKGGKEALDIDELKYSKTKYGNSDELLTVKIRYKATDGDESKLMSKTLKEKDYKPFKQASEDFRFASAAAAFGQAVKNSDFKGDISLKEIADIASAAKGIDENGDRAEFVQLIRTYDASEENNQADDKAPSAVKDLDEFDYDSPLLLPY